MKSYIGFIKKNLKKYEKRYTQNYFLIILSLITLNSIFFDAKFVLVLFYIYIFAKLNKIIPIIFISVILILHLGYLHSFFDNLNNELFKVNTEVNLLGIVSEPPSNGMFNQTIVLELDNYISDAIVKLPLSTNIEVGDKINLTGSLSIFTEDNGYYNYLNSKRIFFEIKDYVINSIEKNSSVLSLSRRVQLIFLEEIDSKYHFSNSNILKGTIFGSKETFDKDLKETFQRAGTSHIVAASGMHVFIIYITIATILSQILPKKVNIIISILFIWSYIFIIGLHNISAIRAGVMLSTVLITQIIGRPKTFFTGILFATSIILINYPLAYQNISFQLSVLATLGLFTLSPILRFHFQRLKLGKYVSEILSTTIAASFVTIPIAMNTFGQISIVGILSNLILSPLVPIIMILGALSIFLKSGIVITIVSSLTIFFLNVINFFARLKFSTLDNHLGVLIIFIFMCLIMIRLHYLKFKSTNKNEAH